MYKNPSKILPTDYVLNRGKSADRDSEYQLIGMTGASDHSDSRS